MKREQLFASMTELDDQLLEQYFSMDQGLARKHARKKVAVRMTLAAACIAVLLSVCVPACMMVAHPAGRAVLRGDSEALTEQLNNIEGFKPWQEQTAQKLEQSLPGPVWELLQTTPIVNVLTQSQYPSYAMKGATFGAYLEQPIYLTYEVDDSEGRLTSIPQIDVRPQQYQDDTAAYTYTVSVEDSVYKLSYVYSLSRSLEHPPVHVYQLYGTSGAYIAYVDVQNGECLYWESPEYSDAAEAEPATEQSMIEQAYRMLSERVRDPEVYTLYTESMGQYFVCEYSRVFYGDYATDRVTPHTVQIKSSDGMKVTFDKAGNVVRYDLGFLGALRHANTQIPTELLSLAFDHTASYVQSYSGTSLEARIVITPDGRLAYAGGMDYVLEKDSYAATAKYLAYLTEADENLQGYELISDGKPAGQRVRLSYHVYTPGSNYKNVRSEFVFDADGNKITEIAYYDGKEYYRVNYTYDEQGNMIGLESISEESNMLNYRYEYEYGENGLPIKQIIFNYTGKQTNEVLFEYDEQGREIRIADHDSVITRTYGEDGSYVERTEGLHSDWVSESEFVYDQNGSLIMEHTVQNGKDTTIQYSYDEQGRLMRRETRQNGELLMYYTTFEHRDGKLYRTINYDASGEIMGIGISEYNLYSECILTDYRDAKGKLIQSESYEYGTVPKK